MPREELQRPVAQDLHLFDIGDVELPILGIDRLGSGKDSLVRSTLLRPRQLARSFVRFRRSRRLPSLRPTSARRKPTSRAAVLMTSHSPASKIFATDLAWSGMLLD